MRHQYPRSRAHARLLAMALAALAVLPIAGCGSSVPTKPTPRPTIASVKADTGHACSPADLALQCVLPAQPLPERVAHATAGGVTPRAAVFHGLYGVDFAWGGPRSCATMRALGARFAIGYLSYDQGKNLGRATVDALHACGTGTVVGWESGGRGGTSRQGILDAREAARQAAADGNTNRPIWFAIDYDATGPDQVPYFQGVRSVLGGRTEAYGSYRLILYLYNRGLVGHQNFQTYAWSRGLWLPASIAPLEQYLNGNTYDNDRAIASDYGQFPAPAPAGPTAAQIASDQRARDVSLRHYHQQGCTLPVLGPRSCGLLAWRVVHFQALTGQHAACFGKRAHPTAAVCQIIRPEVAVWSRARDSSKQATGHLGCGGYHSPTWGRPDPAVCRTLAQRARYFDHKATSTIRAYA